jgi:hypothetical protein
VRNAAIRASSTFDAWFYDHDVEQEAEVVGAGEAARDLIAAPTYRRTGRPLSP